MKKIKQIFFLGLMSIFLSSTIAYASPAPNITNDILTDNSLSNQMILEDILKNNPDVEPEAITILDVQQFETINNEDENIIENNDFNSRAIVYPIIYDRMHSKTQTYSNTILKDVFIISVARGQTVTLGASFSSSLSASATGGISPFTLGINGSTNFSVSASTAFSGPSAGQAQTYNSREFRVAFLGKGGTYTGARYSTLNPNPLAYLSGTWVQPTGYYQYSIDKIY